MEVLLGGHTDQVNAVKFFPKEPGQKQIILSGSVDKTIRVWQFDRPPSSAKLVEVLEGHTNSINCFAVNANSNVVASGAADGTVRIWRISFKDESPHLQAIQEIKLSPKCFPLSLALSPSISSTAKNLFLAVAGTRSSIQMYTSNENASFSHQHTLTGHEGWIRSLDFCRESASPDSDLLLASASQDKYIRLWRIAQDRRPSESKQTDLLDAFEQSLSNKCHKIRCGEASFMLTFEALLLGHEDWVYTISWNAKQDGLRLLSASEDNSLAIWEREELSGVWVPTTRLGAISSLKGSTTATGSAGGFWIGLWSPTGKQLASLGRTGSWRIWEHDEIQDRWRQGIGISGHTQAVKDIAWSKRGYYLLSTGSDQTTRLHAQWNRGSQHSWHEMSRPQIHGYDLNCIDSIGCHEVQFTSGADEKLLRVFDEPKSTAELLHRLSGIEADVPKDLPETADIPVLGLSNKANNAEADGKPSGEDDKDPGDDRAPGVGYFHLREETFLPEEPPTEDRLARHTLWPEHEKLYGHGHEISAVAVSPLGNVVATSCKASSQDHAVVRLFTIEDWRELKPPLRAHSLTVTALRFSPCGRYLLSVGRDRQWTVWVMSAPSPETTEALTSFTLRYCDPKGHSRMILNADWAPTRTRHIFATAGRDKCAKLWSLNERTDVFDCVATIPRDSALTAVAIAAYTVDGKMMVAVGTEKGGVSLHILDTSSWEQTDVRELDEL